MYRQIITILYQGYQYFLIIILNMASSSSLEVAGLISIIKSINQHRISDAAKTMARFSDKSYQIELKNLINRSYLSQISEKKIEQLGKQNCKMQEKIKNLKLKYIKEKAQEADKLQLETSIVYKAKFIDFLFTDNLQKALKDASKLESKKLLDIVHDLIEYKWIKQTYPNFATANNNFKPILDINFTDQTKHIKEMTNNIKLLTNKFNQELTHWLANLTNYQMTQIKLSPDIFSKQVRQMMQTQCSFVKQLHDKILLQQSSFREMMLDTFEQESIQIDSKNFDNTALFQQLISSLKIRKAQAPQRKSFYQNNLKDLIRNISTRLSAIPSCDHLSFSFNEVSLKTLRNCVFNIIEQLAFAKESAKFNQELLLSCVRKKTQFSTSLMKFNVHLNVSAPYLESINNCNLAEKFVRFQTNLNKLLNQSDENQKCSTKLNGFVKTMQTRQENTPNQNVMTILYRQNKRIKEVLQKQMILNNKFSQRLAQSIKKAQTKKTAQLEKHFKNMIIDACKRKQINVEDQFDYIALFELLTTQSYKPSKQFSLETDTKQSLFRQMMHTKEAQNLISMENSYNRNKQKLKDKEVQSSIVILPQFAGQRELREEFIILFSQNQKLKKALEEQRTLNSNFQQRLVQALRKAEATKAAELERQKERYERLRLELNESMDSQLNKILEDKQLFSDKPMFLKDQKVVIE